MKNKFLLLVVLLFSWINVGVAAIVPADVAAETAKVMLSHRGGSEFKGGKAYVETVSRGDNPVYYIVRFEHGGWAMISAEDKAEPLLGYSLDGQMVSEDQMPEVMKDWFEGYVNEIQWARQQPSLKRHYRWDNDLVTRGVEDRIEPLITKHMDQTAPFNAYCPTNAAGERAVVGCVAVGIAQALSVVQFPKKGSGTFSYSAGEFGVQTVNFDSESEYNWSAIMAGTNNEKETARLLYHCGVLSSMDYGVDGSGTIVNDKLVEVLKKYYGFPDHLQFLAKSDYTDTQWKNKMIAELERGRAIIYAGTNDEVGHCFNLDGYDGENMFHVDWGWKGMSNSYFRLDNLTPSSQGTGGSNSGYSQNQRAIIGVAPLADAPYDIQLSNTIVGFGWPAGTYVADVTIYSDKPDAEYDFELKANKNGETYNEAKYEIRDGRLYTAAEIKNSSSYRTLFIKAIHKTSRNSFEKEFSIQLQRNLQPPVDPGAGIDDVLTQEFKLYPVPATDVLTIESPYENGKYAIFNVAGAMMQQGELTETVTTLDISNLSKGSYLLRYSTEQGVVTKSFIVK